MKYKSINKKYPGYNAEYITTANILYNGGDIDKHATRFLDKVPTESGEHYRYRLKNLSYTNHIGAIIDAIVAELLENSIFADTTNVDSPNRDFYLNLQQDLDGNRTTLESFLRLASTYSLLQGEGYAVIYFPDVSEYKVENVLDEEYVRDLLLPKIKFIRNEALINKYCDESGLMTKCVLKHTIQSNDDIFKEEETFIDVFDYYYFNKDGNVVHETYHSKEYISANGEMHSLHQWSLKTFGTVIRQVSEVTKLNAGGRTLNPDDEVKLVSKVTTQFTTMPIIKLDIPQSLCLGKKLVEPARKVLQLRSQLWAAENKCLAAIPVLYRGPELPAPNQGFSETQSDEGRGSNIQSEYVDRGVIQLGYQDELKYFEPDGKYFQLIDQQIKDLVEEMYQITHSAAKSIKHTKVNEAALSKQLDTKSTRIIVSALATTLKTWLNSLFDFISIYRGDNETFNISGLDINSEKPTRQEMITEATSLNLITIHSKTYKSIKEQKLAQELLGSTTSRDEIENINKEIDDYYASKSVEEIFDNEDGSNDNNDKEDSSGNDSGENSQE